MSICPRSLAPAATIAVSVILGLAAFAPHAAAAPVECGDVITEDLRLQHDLTDCPDDGLVVGADRITINLNGHQVSNNCDFSECEGKVGIDNSGGYDRVRIRNGTVDGFGQSILLKDASRNTLAGLEVVDSFPLQANRLTLESSDRNLIKDSEFQYGHQTVLLTDSDRNKITGSSIVGGVGVHTGDGLALIEGSDANTVTRSELDGENSGVSIRDSDRNSFKHGMISGGFYGGIGFSSRDVDRTVVVGNVMEGASQGYGGLWIRGDRSTIRNNSGSTIRVAGDRNLVVGNHAAGEFFDTPIQVQGGDRNVVRGNEATSGTSDVGPVIWVEASASRTTLVGNAASGGRDGREPFGGPFESGDGIRVDAAGTFIRGNTANDNAALGINAVDGVIDGGGNHASGNGDPRQCVGVVCTP